MLVKKKMAAWWDFSIAHLVHHNMILFSLFHPYQFYHYRLQQRAQQLASVRKFARNK
jgi:hypothetical protein